MISAAIKAVEAFIAAINRHSTSWKAIVSNGRIKHWQVYADWTEGFRIIDEDQKSG